MTKQEKTFGLISFIFLLVINIIHLFTCFIPLLVEQIKIGRGTNLEMSAILLWIVEIVLFCGMLVGIVFLLISLSRKEDKKYIVVDCCLIATMIIQLILTNVFVFF